MALKVFYRKKYETADREHERKMKYKTYPGFGDQGAENEVKCFG